MSFSKLRLKSCMQDSRKAVSQPRDQRGDSSHSQDFWYGEYNVFLQKELQGNKGMSKLKSKLPSLNLYLLYNTYIPISYIFFISTFIYQKISPLVPNFVSEVMCVCVCVCVYFNRKQV